MSIDIFAIDIFAIYILFLWYNWCVQIIALNKTKERMRPYHVNHETEDPDIKKIKKVRVSLLQVIVLIVFIIVAAPRYLCSFKF